MARVRLTLAIAYKRQTDEDVKRVFMNTVFDDFLLLCNIPKHSYVLRVVNQFDKRQDPVPK